MTPPPSAEGPDRLTDSAPDLARDSLTVAKWTVLSRVTGVGRVVAIAAVLGPTYFGNLFQATNLLPNLTFELLTGTLFATLLVPPLVRYVDRGDPQGTQRLAGGFLGLALIAFAAVAAAVILAAPLILWLLTAGVASPEVAAGQRQAGWLLLALLMPQVMLYGVAGTAGAVLNAHGRFALPAGAPALENLGVIATLAATGVLFGIGTELGEVATGQLWLLGLGSTAAVGLHAGVLWWGSWRQGVRLIPRAGWRDPEVRQVLRLAVPSLGYAGLSGLRTFAVLVVANRVPGGVVAFQMALNFYNLPVAVGARPVAVALLPSLARHHHEGATQPFRDELVRGAGLIAFLTIPAAVAYLALAGPLARAVSYGAMATEAGVTLIAVSLAALAAGVVAESAFVLGTHASYARGDARSPLRASVFRTGTVLIGGTIAFLVHPGALVLLVLGLAFSAGDVVSAVLLAGRLRSRLPDGDLRLGPAVLRAATASLVMILPAYAIAAGLPGADPDAGVGLTALAGGALIGAVLYLLLQRLVRSPELATLREGFAAPSSAPTPASRP